MNIQLGDSVDLLAGLKACFPSRELPWRSPPGIPLITQECACPNVPVVWQDVVISLHETVSDLVDTMFNYSVEPMVNLDGLVSITSGVLTEEAGLKALSESTGLNISSNSNSSYLLVRLHGVRAKMIYEPEYYAYNRKVKILNWSTAEGRNALARLRLKNMRRLGYEFTSDITARQARRYLEYFHDFGTHIVSSLTFGEQFYQIFELSRRGLEAIRSDYNQMSSRSLEGPLALGMSHYLTPPWIEAESPILSSSGALPESIWAELDAYSANKKVDKNLLSLSVLPATILNEALSSVSARNVIAASFSCLALYLEDFRAENWARILRGSLEQRFNKKVSCGWKRRRRFCPITFFKQSSLTTAEGVYSSIAEKLPALALAADFSDCDNNELNFPEHGLLFFSRGGVENGSGACVSVSDIKKKVTSIKSFSVEGAIRVLGPTGKVVTLVDSVWLGCNRDGRLQVVGAPLEVGSEFLYQYRSQLSIYISLFDQLQGPVFEPEIALSMRFCVQRLLNVVEDHDSLSRLKWQALQCYFGVGANSGFNLATVKGVKEAQFKDLLSTIMLLSARSQVNDINLLMDARLKLRRFYLSLPECVSGNIIRERTSHLIEKIENVFERLLREGRWSEAVYPVMDVGRVAFREGGTEDLPFAKFEGESAEGDLWNSFLSIRVCFVHIRAILNACNGEFSGVIDQLLQEPISIRDSLSNAGEQFIITINELCGSQSIEVSALLDELLNLHHDAVDLCSSAVLFSRIHRLDIEVDEMYSNFHLQSLILLLELLNLSQWLGYSCETLNSISLTALNLRVSRIQAQ